MPESPDRLDLPADLRAESAILNYAQIYPNCILSMGVILDDFYDRKHRFLWKAMIAVAMDNSQIQLDSGRFFELLFLHTSQHGQQYSVRELLSSFDPFADWQYDSWLPDAPDREIDYWIERVKRCVVARKLIDAAQRIAERAYKVPNENFDVVEACAVLTRIAGVSTMEEFGMRLPI